jgi:hypothetical protein
LCAVLSVVADDLHSGEQQGYPLADCSRPDDDPARHFNLKTILLYVSADYPAQRLASGFAHSGALACHYCTDNAAYNYGVSTCIHDKYYRWLPANEPNRLGPNGPPAERTHDTVCADGLVNDAEMASKLQRAARRNNLTDIRRDGIAAVHIAGVNRWCPLAVLHMFDVVWDFVFDVMHAADVFKRYIVPTMKGERVPKPKMLDTNGHTGESLQRCARRNKDARQQNAVAVEVTISILIVNN